MTLNEMLKLHFKCVVCYDIMRVITKSKRERHAAVFLTTFYYKIAQAKNVPNLKKVPTKVLLYKSKLKFNKYLTIGHIVYVFEKIEIVHGR